MAKRRNMVVVLACGITAVGLTWALLTHREREPSYQGVTLSQWYLRWAKTIDSEDAQSVAQHSEAAAAIRQIGTNALPTLLSQLKRRTSSSPIQDFVGRLPSQVSENPIVVSAFSDADKVEPTGIFVLLGSQAAPAVPELTSFLNVTNNPDLVQLSAFCLAAIGDAGLPPLLAALADQKHPSCYAAAYWLGVVDSPFTFGTNIAQAVPLLIQCTTATDQRLAEAAIKAIGHIHQEPQIAIPALANCRTSTNPWVRRFALGALAEFGEPAIPHLVTALADSDEDVRRTGTNLLMLIAPQALTNAPPH